MADTHFLIEKGEAQNRTLTSVRLLDEGERITELARMIGGVGESAVAHAKTMIEWAEKEKK
jgi:DNA repair protein RecN (Recombination protein N)